MPAKATPTPTTRKTAATGAAAAFPLVEPDSRKAWRAWLHEHHATITGIWLVYRKKSPARHEAYDLSYDAAVEEALCYGWIDSVMHPLDAARFKQMFTPRKRGSAWSGLNKRRIEALAQAGLIAPPGQAKIDAAKRDGAWTFLDEVEALVVPRAFARAMAAKSAGAARKNYDSMPPGARRQFLYRVVTAKRPETRAARIVECVSLLKQNRRADGSTSKAKLPAHAATAKKKGKP